MITTHRILLLCLGLTVSAKALPAQGDPMREIQEIAEAVDKQLKEIDQLLLESGKKSQSRDKPKQLLEQASERSATAQDGIDKLIEKLTEMKDQGGGGGGGGQNQSDQQQQQGQSQDGQSQGQPKPGQGQGQGNRRENQTPDYVQQPQEGQQPGQEGQQQPGENKPGDKQQGQPQPSGQPSGGEEAKTGGQNTTGSPQESETGPGQPGTGEGSWGELQPYLNFLRNRGASPKVPEKFRKYYEAYLKQKQKGDK